MNYLRLKELRSWLAEHKYAWLSIAVIAISLLFSLGPGTGERRILLTGLFLQLCGIVTVFKVIGNILSKAKEYLSRFPLGPRVIPVQPGTGSISASGNKGIGVFVTYGPGDNPTIEARLDACNRSIEAIHNRITTEIGEVLQDISATLTLEEQSRQNEYALIRDKLEATITDNAYTSLIAASFLFVGVIFATVANDIVCIRLILYRVLGG